MSGEMLQLVLLGLGGVFLLADGIWLGWILVDQMWHDVRPKR